jgi:hypothetical protein
MKMNIRIFVFLVVAILLACGESRANGCAEPTASASLDVNNVRALLLNGGDKFWDVFGGGNPMYEIPKGSGVYSIFTSALWLSARDLGGNLYTAGQTYRQRGFDFWPGRLNDFGEIDSLDCLDGDKMYSVYGTDILEAKAGRSISFDVSRWANSFAPFYDSNGDGIYDPSFGDYPVYDVAHPEMIPGQMVWWVINDKGNQHTAYGGALPLGVEVQITASAYASSNSDIVNNSTIYRYQIQNKSANSFSEFRVSEFADFDLGGSDDDYIGCDLSTNSLGKKRNLFYCYNADNYDDPGASQGYGAAPPAVGLTFLNLGRQNNGTPYTVGGFMLHQGGTPGIDGSARDAIELERYMKSLWQDGFPLTYGQPTGRGGTDPTQFIFPGDTDPLGRAPWFETVTPGERKSLTNLSPRLLAAGEMMTIELAYVWARDSSNTASLEKLRRSVDTLITAHENFFANFSTGIASVKTKALRIYPNPSSDLLYIEGMTEAEELVIYASNGKVVMRERISAQQALNISILANGIYFVRAGNYTGKFVKK